jgi:hypothetical protein
MPQTPPPCSKEEVREGKEGKTRKLYYCSKNSISVTTDPLLTYGIQPNYFRYVLINTGIVQSVLVANIRVVQ